MNASDRTQKRILVVDNDESISGVCRRVLTREGFEVEVAADERSAQDMIDRNHYHIYLINIQEPTIHGSKASEWLQKSHSDAGNRVIFTTGSLISDEIVTFAQDNGALLLPKPFTARELTAAVEESLERIEGHWAFYPAGHFAA
jgi:DNA-binding response OmpR family regulator